MDSLKLDTSCTALILVDLQRGIVGMPTSPYFGSFVVEKGASLAAAFRRMYATVVYVRVDLSNMMSIAVDLSHGDPNNPPPSSASELVAEMHIGPQISDVGSSSSALVSASALLRNILHVHFQMNSGGVGYYRPSEPTSCQRKQSSWDGVRLAIVTRLDKWRTTDLLSSMFHQVIPDGREC
jgi:hypothetical protein